MSDLRASREKYGLNARLVKHERKARRGGLQDRRSLREGDRGDRPAPRGRDSVRHRADAERAARADPVVPHRRGERPREVRHRVGCRTRHRRSTRSTASSRCISIRAASRAAGRHWSSPSIRKRRRSSRRSATTRSGSRTTSPADAKYHKPNVTGHRRQRHRRDRRNGRFRTGHADRHQPSQRSAHSRAVRQQVRLAVERRRGLRQVDARHDARRVLMDARGGRARQRSTAPSPTTCTPTCTR